MTAAAASQAAGGSVSEQAVAAGIDRETVEDVDDSEDPKGSLISLLVEARMAAEMASQNRGW